MSSFHVGQSNSVTGTNPSNNISNSITSTGPSAIFTMDGMYITDCSNPEKPIFKLAQFDGTIIAEGEQAQKLFNSLSQRQRAVGLTEESVIVEHEVEIASKQSWFDKIAKLFR